MPKIVDHSGKRFGRLVALRKTLGPDSRARYECVCDCGASKNVASANLINGNVKSCGCLRAETTARINSQKRSPVALRKNPFYHRWATMIQRCHNTKNPYYKNYGGRGITVCDEWRSSFSRFAADMGEPPSSTATVERIDNSQGYTPENCLWAERSAQVRNSRATIKITIQGTTLCAKDWSKRVKGLHYQKITKAYRQHGIEAAKQLIEAHL